MSMRRGMKACIVLLLLLNPFYVQVQSVDTGEVHDYLNPLDVNIPVQIKLWNYDPSLVEMLNKSVYHSLVQQSRYPRSNVTDQWQVDIDDRFYGLQNKINLTFELATQNEVTLFENTFRNYSNPSTVSSPVDASNSYTGVSVLADDLDQFFNSTPDYSGYTIHLANFSFLDDIDSDSYHWFRIGLSYSINSITQDMRNVFNTGDRSILFDPNAIAPYFGITPAIHEFTDNQFSDYMVNSINSIIEQFIVGTPQTYNRLNLEREVRVDRIIISTDTSDIEYLKTADRRAYNYFEKQVFEIFQNFDLKTREINSDISDIPELQQFLNDSTVMIDGEPTVIVDFGFAEKFKNEIRENYYIDWPSRFYYGIFLFADGDRRYMMNVTEDGEVTNKLIEYNVGELGFAMDSLRDWYEIPTVLIDSRRVTARTLQIFGMNFGIANLTSNVTMQIDSVMSPYGYTNTWDYEYTQVEKDQILRRFAVAFGQKAESNTKNLLNRIDSSVFFWHNTTGLELLISKINDAQDELKNANYTGALELYFNALDDFEDESENFLYTRNFVNYGSVLFVFVLLLAYYSKILFEESLTKEEFKQRLKKNREVALKSKEKE